MKPKRLQGRHHGRNARRTEATLRRLPHAFGWELLRRLFELLSPYLDDGFGVDIAEIIRKEDLGAYLHLADDWSALWTSDPLMSGQPLKGAVAYLLCKVLSKTEGMELQPAEVRREECLHKVYLMDQTLRAPILDEQEDPVFLRTLYWVRRIMGPVPEVEDMNQLARHGPGSTALTSYELRSPYFKYSMWPYGVGPGCRDLFKQLISADARWLGSLEHDYRERNGIPAWSILNWETFWASVLEDCPYNVLTTVPKNGLKDRPIAKEPLGNVYCQTAVGSWLKRCLLTETGVDLTNQQRNRELAKLASVWNHPLSPCTFDLSNASDTVSWDLVQSLVTPQWGTLLASLRSKYGTWPDHLSWRYAKVSSMGNATTFEMESIIFLSLLYALIDVYGDTDDRRYTSVFGDDLVFPRYLSAPAKVYLKAFGFQVNQTKSFDEGTFFESCGKDYKFGKNIRPVFLRRIPERVSDLLTFHNQLQSWFIRTMGVWMPDSLSDYLLSYVEVPRGVECLFGPPHTDTFDAWVFRKGHMRVRYVVRLVNRTRAIRSFHFGRLLHDLKYVETERGSRFRVNGRELGEVVHRASSLEPGSGNGTWEPSPLIGVFDDTDEMQEPDWPSWPL